jgi:hypothetical protein
MVGPSAEYGPEGFSRYYYTLQSSKVIEQDNLSAIDRALIAPIGPNSHFGSEVDVPSEL